MPDKKTSSCTQSTIPLPAAEASRAADGCDFAPFCDSASPDLKSESTPSACAQPDVVTEREIILAAQNGMHSALEHLLSQYSPMVYRTARRYSNTTEDAEDIVQETMFHACKSIRSFRHGARFSSWLVAIAINVAISLKRKENRVRWVYLDESVHSYDELLPMATSSDHRWNPEQAHLNKERHNVLRRAISRQHPKFQMILRWCDLDEVPIDQAARRLGITHSAAKSRLFRARRMLLGTAGNRVGESR